MKEKNDENVERPEDWRQFQSEAAYADSLLKSALGDSEGSIASLERALELLPTYAPAILSMGSVEYQSGHAQKGKKLFLSLVELPDDTEDLPEIIDKAGSFLIHIKEYSSGYELYRKAISRFPDVAALYQGLGCCAGHKGLHSEAIEASRHALVLEPQNQQLMNDLGWSLLEAGRLEEARKALSKAVDMDPSDELSQENLRYCRSIIKKNVELKIEK